MSVVIHFKIVNKVFLKKKVPRPKKMPPLKNDLNMPKRQTLSSIMRQLRITRNNPPIHQDLYLQVFERNGWVK